MTDFKTIDNGGHLFYGLCFSNDSELFAATSEDRSVRLWNTVDWNLEALFSTPTSYTRAMAFSSDSRLFAAADSEGVKVHELAPGKTAMSLPCPIGSGELISSVSFTSERNELIATIDDEGANRFRLIRWNLRDGTVVCDISFGEIVIDLGLDGDGGIFIDTYDPRPSHRAYRMRRLDGETAVKLEFALSAPGGVPIISSGHAIIGLGNRCYGAHIELQRLPGGESLYSRGTKVGSSPLISIAPSCKSVLISETNYSASRSELSMVNISTGADEWRHQVSSKLDHVRFSPDGRLIVAASVEAGQAQLYDAAQGSILIKALQSSRASCFSPNSKWYASGGRALKVADVSHN